MGKTTESQAGVSGGQMRAPQLEWSEDLRGEESELGFEGQVGFAQNLVGEECFFPYLLVIIFLKFVESLRSLFMLVKRQIHKPSAEGSSKLFCKLWLL